MILLDEIEKAHPDVFNMLLQVMDDGRLTDGQGRTVDFKNTVLIMTSNIGPRAAIDGRDRAAHFKPEFINRLDDDREFHRSRASRSARSSTCRSRSSSRRVRERGIAIELDDDARDAARQPGLRPHLRRPAAEARDPEAARRQARAEAARGRGPRGRHRARRCRAGELTFTKAPAGEPAVAEAA